MSEDGELKFSNKKKLMVVSKLVEMHTHAHSIDQDRG